MTGDLQSIPTKHSQPTEVPSSTHSSSSKKRLLPLPSNKLNKRMDTKLMSSPMYSHSEFHYNKENLVHTSPIKKDYTPKNLKDFNLNSKQLLDIIQTPKPLADVIGNDSSVNKYLIFSDKDSIHNNSIHMSDGVEIQSQGKLGTIPRLPAQKVHTQPLDSGDESDDNLLPSNFDEDLENEPTAKFLNSKMYSQEFIEQLKLSHHSNVSDLNSQLSLKDQKISELMLALNQAQTELKTSEIEIKDTNYHNAKLLKANSNQQSKYQSLEKSLEELKAKFEQSQQKNNELMTQVTSSKENEVKANDDIELLNKENNKLNDQLNMLATDNNELIKHVEDLQSKNEDLTHTCQALKEKLDQSIEENITKQQNIQSLTDELSSANESLRELKQQNEIQSEQDAKALGDLTSQYNEAKEKITELSNVANEKQIIINGFEEEIQSLGFTKDDWTSRIEELTKINDELYVSQGNASSQITKLTEENEELNSQVQQSFLKISQFQSQLTELNEENSVLHDKLNQLNKKQDNMTNVSNENLKLLETLGDLKIENERLNKLTEKYNKINYKKLMNEYNKLKTHLTGLETNNLEMSDKFREMNIKYNSIVDQISIYQQELQLIRKTD